MMGVQTPCLWRSGILCEFHVGSFQELHAFPEAVTAHGPSSHGQGFEFCTSACPRAGSEASHLVGVRFDLTEASAGNLLRAHSV